MARRSKEQIRIDKEVDAAVKTHTNGRQFNIFDLSKINDAGQAAGKAGQDIDAAVKAACEKYEIK
jgi:hypothetical protein